ncbi:MAG TPA: hypothetical protein VGS27_32540 [Candidatus Sulfotelmatobacter sp.]|nr:hypothetical protein [Candidatus Sulfotelmatobacter sp.]
MKTSTDTLTLCILAVFGLAGFALILHGDRYGEHVVTGVIGVMTGRVSKRR